MFIKLPPVFCLLPTYLNAEEPKSLGVLLQAHHYVASQSCEPACCPAYESFEGWAHHLPSQQVSLPTAPSAYGRTCRPFRCASQVRPFAQTETVVVRLPSRLAVIGSTELALMHQPPPRAAFGMRRAQPQMGGLAGTV